MATLPGSVADDTPGVLREGVSRSQTLSSRFSVVTMVCSVCWLSASARRTSARHCLFRRMSVGVTPVTTGSMTVCVDRMHPDTRRRLLFSAVSSQCLLALRHYTAALHCGTTLRHNTGEQYSAGAKASVIVDF